MRAWERRPNSEIDIFWADWGQGKSHTLMYVQGHFQRNATAIVHYVQLPPLSSGSSFAALFRQIMLDFPLENLARRVFDRFQHNVRDIFIQGAPAVRPIYQLLWLIATNSPGHDVAQRWLKAQGVTAREIRQLIIAGRSLSIPAAPRNAQECQNTLAAIFDVAINFPSRGSGQIVLLIDEFQRVGELGNRQMREVCDSLHLIYNRHAEGLRFMLAFATGNPDAIADFITGDMLARVQSKIGLPPPSRADVYTYVSELLTIYRVDQSLEDPFRPFGQQAAKTLCDYVYDLSDGFCTLRKINIVFDRCFNWFLDEGVHGHVMGGQQGEVITLDLVQECLRKIGPDLRALLTSDAEVAGK